MTIDRDALAALSDDALRAEADRLGVAGDLAAYSRAELEAAVALRLIDDPSSVGWAMRTWRKSPPAEAESHAGIFIDRGLPIPERYAGGHWLRAAVRDMRTAYAYWETDQSAGEGWHVAAVRRDGVTIAQFTTSPIAVGSGFLVVDDVTAVARVRLSRRTADGLEPVLEVALQTEAPQRVGDETWLDVRTSTPVNPPARGRWEGASESAATQRGLAGLPGYPSVGAGAGLPTSGNLPSSRS